MLGRGVNAELRRRPPERFWGTALPLLRSADAVFANLECAITRHRTPWSRTSKVFHFGAAPEAIAVLRAGNIRCVSLANNHTLDYEVEGLLEMLRLLDEAGIARAGAGRNLAEARRSAIVDVAGIPVGVVSATDNEPPFAATAEGPGVFYLELESDRTASRVLANAAQAARDAGAGFVVLSLHWGPNMVAAPPRTFRRLAYRAMEFADLIHGHSAHVFQGPEVRDGRLILYDTGDFLDDYAVDPDLRNDWSFLFLLELSQTGVIERLRLHPVRLDYAQVNLATGDEHGAICDRMIERARAVGTTLMRTRGGLEIEVRGGQEAGKIRS